MSLNSNSRFIPFESFEQLHQTLRSQLAQDIEALFAYADLPSPLNEACRYVMTSQGKLVRPLLVASAFASVLGDADELHDSANYESDDFKDSAHKDSAHKDSNYKDDSAKPLLQLTINQNKLDHLDDSISLDNLLSVETHYDMCRRAALAVELLHTYSLVHDDLPCMDDDELRRGQPTCHIVFDEATALLAGDVLQTLAFEVLTAEIATFAPFDETIASALIAIFSPRARRMVAGQMLDLNAEARTDISQNDLEAIHRDKTGALIEAAMLMGGVCAGATALQRMALQECAQNIGLAFQVQDDILDVTTSTDTLGKPAGSDEKLDKSTYVKLMGVDAATDYAQLLFEEGRSAITRELRADNNNALLAVIEWLWTRQK